jgi:hypothetical protein
MRDGAHIDRLRVIAGARRELRAERPVRFWTRFQELLAAGKSPIRASREVNAEMGMNWHRDTALGRRLQE